MASKTATEIESLRPEAAFRAFLESGELRLQQCSNCIKFIYYPRSVCPYCHSNAFQWRACSGGGVVYSVTVVPQKPERGGDYNVALIDLDEGVRVLSRIDDIAPADIAIGMAVKAKIDRYQDAPILAFTPA